MLDPLSILAAVVGLVATSAKITSTAKQLYNSRKDAPTSIRRISEEMDQLHLIFGRVQMLLEGYTQKKPSRSRLTMLPLHHLMTILSGCVLAHSSLDKKLSEVAGSGSLDNAGGQNSATTRPMGLGARVRWALWKEAEAEAILVELERYKSSLHMMLTIIQCNSMDEASQQLANLHEQIERISEKISESHNDVAVQLRELISRRHYADGTSSVSITHQTTSTECSLPASLSNAPSIIVGFNNMDGATRTTSSSSSLSIRSVRSLIPSWGGELKNSRPYKRLWRPEIDLSSGSVFSKDSRATKGDTWSMLSDMSLGDLSISVISVLELPISLSDLYDPIPYQQSTRRKQTRNWNSHGKLHSAIHGANIFIFRTLLNLGADPNETDANGALLAHAVRKPEGLVFCRLLLDRGAQVDTRDSSSRTPLSHAAQGGRTHICELLLNRGAIVDAADSGGRTPLSHCAGLGNDFVCKLLLDRGAKVDTMDSTGRTPLSHCAGLGSYFICMLLLDRGAQVDTRDSNGRTPLFHSARHGCDDICKLLLNRGAAVDATDANGRTPLSYCGGLGSASVCKLLLDRGAQVDTRDLSGSTPLSYCAQLANDFVCKLLLDRGAQVDTRDSSGRTPLSHCAGLRNDSLDRGAQVDTRGSSGSTPPSHASRDGRAYICEQLLNRGAAVDAADSRGRTPLSHCAEIGNYPACKLLLERGAQVNTRDSSCSTPLLHSAQQHCCDIIYKLLLNRGAAFDAADSSGRTPLSHCVGRGSVSACQLLLDRGAQVDTRDLSGRTPLSYSTELNRYPGHYLCKLLLDTGAKVDLADYKGRTPLSYAAERGNLAISGHLLHRGANVGARDFNDHTPLWYAQMWGEAAGANDMFNLLLSAGVRNRQASLERTIIGHKVVYR